MHRKGELSNIGSICSVYIELVDINYNGFVAVKLKEDLIKNRSYAFFCFCLSTLMPALDYLKPHIKFYVHISILKGMSSNEMSRFSSMEPLEVEKLKPVLEKMSHRSL